MPFEVLFPLRLAEVEAVIRDGSTRQRPHTQHHTPRRTRLHGGVVWWCGDVMVVWYGGVMRWYWCGDMMCTWYVWICYAMLCDMMWRTEGKMHDSNTATLKDTGIFGKSLLNNDDKKKRNKYHKRNQSKVLKWKSNSKRNHRRKNASIVKIELDGIRDFKYLHFHSYQKKDN